MTGLGRGRMGSHCNLLRTRSYDDAAVVMFAFALISVEVYRNIGMPGVHERRRLPLFSYDVYVHRYS